MPTSASVVPATPEKKTKKTTRKKASSSKKSLNSEEISVILEAHTQWLQSNGQEGKRANFRGLELDKTDFSGRNLTEANFRGAQLHQAKFRKATLNGADFSDAILSKADLREISAIGATFARAQLANVKASQAILSESSFANAELPEADFEKSVLVHTNFRLAVLEAANLTDADFTDATLREAVLKQARLESTNFDNADLRQSVLTAAIMDRASLRNTQFRGAEMMDVDFSKTDISVAHDLDMRHHLQAFQKEKGQLQEEGMALDRRAKELRWKESRFEQQQKLFQQQSAVQEHALEQLRTQMEDKLVWMRLLRGFWAALGVTFIITSFVAATMAELHNEGAVLLFTVYGCIFCISLIFYITTRQCNDCIKILSYYMADEPTEKESITVKPKGAKNTGTVSVEKVSHALS